MKQQDKTNGRAVATSFARSVQAPASRPPPRRRSRQPAKADSESNDEKRKARYKETDHVKAFYRVNRYPAKLRRRPC